MFLFFFFIASCFFFYISSLCVYTRWSISWKVLRLLSHQDLAQGFREPSWTTLLCLQSTGATPMRISMKLASLSPLSRLSAPRRERLCSCLYLQPLALSLAQGRGSITIGGWMDEWILLLPTSHQQRRVRSKQTKDAIGSWERSPGAEKQLGRGELVCAWAH